MGQTLSAKAKSAFGKKTLAHPTAEAPPGAGPPRALLFKRARLVQISGGNISVVGGDVHHHNAAYKDDLRVFNMLKDINNLRTVHVAALRRATPGTGLWIFEWDVYRIWLKRTGDIQILWGFGIPGAGKTILASIIIDALEARAKKSSASVCVCYLYFRYSDHTKATVQTFLEILVKQTAERHPHCRQYVEAAFAMHHLEGTRPTEQQLISLLKKCIAAMRNTFYILDALDEAPQKVQYHLLERLASLNVKLFITSRPCEILAALFPDARSFQISAQPHDLDLHISHSISSSPDLRTLLAKSDDYKAVALSIKENCNGMFLHASLQLDALGECTNLHDIKRTLVEFPSDIEDVYLQTWRRILDQSPQKTLLAARVLQWVLNTTRSLKLEELQYAVATSFEDKFDASRMVAGETLISFCRGLITVEKGSGLVRLIHYSARETLQKVILGISPQPHSLLAKTCIARLVEHGFQDADFDELDIALQQEILLPYAAQAWSYHARNALEDVSTASRVRDFIAGCRSFPVVPEFGTLNFLGALHVAAYFDYPLAFAGSEHTLNPNIPTKNQRTLPLHLACCQRSYSALSELLRLPNILVNELDSDGPDGWTALMWAVQFGDKEAVRLLLSHPSIDVNVVDGAGSTPLHAACFPGHPEIVNCILAHPSVAVNAVDNYGQTPLICALKGACEDTISLLLEHPHIDTNVFDADGSAPLHSVVERRQERHLVLLLRHCLLDVNIPDADGQTALMIAAQSGQENIVRLLLAHPQININQVDNAGWTAAQHAFSNGQRRIMQILPCLNAVLTALPGGLPRTNRKRWQPQVVF